MSDNKSTKPLNITQRRSTIEEFRDYCGAEKQHRQNSEETFDAGLYDQAVELALQQLISLQKEGWT